MVFYFSASAFPGIKSDGHIDYGILISDLSKEKTDEPKIATRNYGCHEKITNTSMKRVVQQPNAVEGHYSMPVLSSHFDSANLLLTQQGCVNC